MIKVSDKASLWFQNEFELKSDQGIRITAKGYGHTNKHEGISVAIWVDKPVNIKDQTYKDGLLYYVEELDDWFIQDYDLIIDYNDNLDEPKYIFKEK